MQQTFQRKRDFLHTASLLIGLLTGIFLGSFASASEKLHLVTQGNGDPKIEGAFQIGLANLNSGRPEMAIEKFSAILAKNPSLVRVRLELARAYFVAGQWERARREFFTVLSGDLPEPVRLRVLAFIKAIDGRRGFDWDLSIGAVSVGDRRKYDSDQIFLNIGGVSLPFTLQRGEASEIGLRLSGAANFRKEIASPFENIDTVAFAGVSFDIEEARTSKYDDYNFSARMGLRTLAPFTTISFGPIISTRFAAGEHFENRIALELAFERRNLLGGSVFGYVNHARLHNLKSDNLDGDETGAGIGIRRSLGGTGSVGLSLFFEQKNVEYTLENYHRKGIRVFGYFDTRFGFTVTPSVFFEKKDYRLNNPLLTGDPDETSVGAIIRIEKNDVFVANGFSPFFEAQTTRTRSSIEAFSFIETNFQAGLARRF